MKKIQTAGGVVVNKKGEVVIVSNHGCSWSLPKGKIEGEETPFQAAEREVCEECGIHRLKFIQNLGTYERRRSGERATKELRIIHIFLFRSDQKKLVPVDPLTNPEALWVSKKRALEMFTHAKDKEFFQSVMNLI